MQGLVLAGPAIAALGARPDAAPLEGRSLEIVSTTWQLSTLMFVATMEEGPEVGRKHSPAFEEGAPQRVEEGPSFSARRCATAPNSSPGA